MEVDVFFLLQIKETYNNREQKRKNKIKKYNNNKRGVTDIKTDCIKLYNTI